MKSNLDNSNLTYLDNSVSTTNMYDTAEPDLTGSLSIGTRLATVTQPYSYISSWTTADCLCEKSEIDLLITYLSEKEITELLSKIKSKMKNDDESAYKKLICKIVRNRHFSEEFLLDNFEDLNKSDILAKHEADIYSGEYTQLGLLISVGIDR